MATLIVPFAPYVRRLKLMIVVLAVGFAAMTVLTATAATVHAVVMALSERERQDPPKNEAKPVTKKGKIKELLKLNGTEEQVKLAIKDSIKMIENGPLQGSLPDGFMEAFKKFMKPNEIIAMIVPIYEEELDEETIDALIAFAQTDAGKKLAKATPALVAKTMKASIAYGERSAKEALKKLNERED